MVNDIVEWPRHVQIIDNKRFLGDKVRKEMGDIDPGDDNYSLLNDEVFIECRNVYREALFLFFALMGDEYPSEDFADNGYGPDADHKRALNNKEECEKTAKNYLDNVFPRSDNSTIEAKINVLFGAFQRAFGYHAKVDMVAYARGGTGESGWNSKVSRAWNLDRYQVEWKLSELRELVVETDREKVGRKAHYPAAVFLSVAVVGVFQAMGSSVLYGWVPDVSNYVFLGSLGGSELVFARQTRWLVERFSMAQHALGGDPSIKKSITADDNEMAAVVRSFYVTPCGGDGGSENVLPETGTPGTADDAGGGVHPDIWRFVDLLKWWFGFANRAAVRRLRVTQS